MAKAMGEAVDGVGERRILPGVLYLLRTGDGSGGVATPRRLLSLRLAAGGFAATHLEVDDTGKDGSGVRTGNWTSL